MGHRFDQKVFNMFTWSKLALGARSFSMEDGRGMMGSANALLSKSIIGLMFVVDKSQSTCLSESKRQKAQGLISSLPAVWDLDWLWAHPRRSYICLPVFGRQQCEHVDRTLRSSSHFPSHNLLQGLASFASVKVSVYDLLKA